MAGGAGCVRLTNHDRAWTVRPPAYKIQTNNTALNKTKKYLQVLYDESIEALKKDIPIEEGLKTIAQSEKNNWILFDRVNPGNIVRTFMRYEWEY